MKTTQSSSQDELALKDNSTTVYSASKIPNNFRNIKTLLEKSLPQLSLAAPSHLDPKRILRIVLTEIRKNESLLECNPPSIIGALMQATQLGLEVGSELGQAYLVPFFNSKNRRYECQFILGFRGMITLARNSGEVSTISAHPVYEKDEFNLCYGLHENLTHTPFLGPNPGELLGVYAIAKLKNDGYQFIFIKASEIECIKFNVLNKIKSDYAKKCSPWNTSYQEMANKTAIRKLFKYLPISVSINSAFNRDEEIECGTAFPSISDEIEEPTFVLEKNGKENNGDIMTATPEIHLQSNTSLALKNLNNLNSEGGI